VVGGPGKVGPLRVGLGYRLSEGRCDCDRVTAEKQVQRNFVQLDELTRALEIVDSILEATRADRADGGAARGADCVRQAVADLGDIRAEVITTVTGEFPIPPAALRIVLRNLLTNAVAAGAERIFVSAVARGDRRVLVVDDDGAGLGSVDRYACGAQLGLALSRRLVARFGGVLELKPRASGGTRAVLVLNGTDG
jgi:signal transduction histidine kinase